MFHRLFVSVLILLLWFFFYQGKMVSELINANPVIYEKKERRVRSVPSTADEYDVEPIDQEEIFDILFVCVCNCIDI